MRTQYDPARSATLRKWASRMAGIVLVISPVLLVHFQGGGIDPHVSVELLHAGMIVVAAVLDGPLACQHYWAECRSALMQTCVGIGLGTSAS